jgi:hypothetical protein
MEKYVRLARMDIFWTKEAARLADHTVLHANLVRFAINARPDISGMERYARAVQSQIVSPVKRRSYAVNV